MSDGRLMAAVGSPLVLASGSRVRLRLLEGAGLFVSAEAAGVDEAEVKSALRAEGATAAQVAETLAELKALRVSSRHPGALVVGADQMLDCGGLWFDKPVDLARARAHLEALSGRSHSLETAVCVVRDGSRLWHHNEAARLFVRPLSEAFIEAYLAAVGDRALESVGGYQLEGPGVQLFERVEGSFFSILGLPLLPLLTFLRANGVIPV